MMELLNEIETFLNELDNSSEADFPEDLNEWMDEVLLGVIQRVIGKIM